MATHRLLWKTSSERDLKRIDRQYQPAIIRAAEALMEDPFPPHCRKLRGGVSSYRIRVGDYRVIYRVNNIEIIIVHVRHRKDAYRS